MRTAHAAQRCLQKIYMMSFLLVPGTAHRVSHTQVADMSFDEILDLTAVLKITKL